MTFLPQQATADPTTPSKRSTLIPTLSKLSQSISRPDLPPADTFTQRTFDYASSTSKSLWRRTGLPSYFEHPEELNSSIASTSCSSNSYSPEKKRGSSSRLIDTTKILYPASNPHPSGVPLLVLFLDAVSQMDIDVDDEEIFKAVFRRLEPWVGEEGDGYAMIILSSGSGLSTSRSGGGPSSVFRKGGDWDVGDDAGAKGKERERRRLPSVRWWVWRWGSMPRKYKKNLKKTYIVHPSGFTKSVIPYILPFLSPKSYKKLVPVTSLLQLFHSHNISLGGISLSLSDLKEESRVIKLDPSILGLERASRIGSEGAKAGDDERGEKDGVGFGIGGGDDPERSPGWGSTITKTFSYATSYIPLVSTSPSPQYRERDEEEIPRREGFWGRDVVELLEEDGEGLRLLMDLLSVFRNLEDLGGREGIFRTGCNSPLLSPIQALLSLPISHQPTIPWTLLAREDVHLIPTLLKRWLRSLTLTGGGLIPRDIYEVVRSIGSVSDIKSTLLPAIPQSTLTVLYPFIHVLHHLTDPQLERMTKMISLNYAIVVAPCLLKGDAVEDAGLCAKPSSLLPLKSPGGLDDVFGDLRGVEGARIREGREGGNVHGCQIRAKDLGDPRRSGGTLVGVLEGWIRGFPIIFETPADEGRCTCPLWGLEPHQDHASQTVSPATNLRLAASKTKDTNGQVHSARVTGRTPGRRKGMGHDLFVPSPRSRSPRE